MAKKPELPPELQALQDSLNHSSWMSHKGGADKSQSYLARKLEEERRRKKENFNTILHDPADPYGYAVAGDVSERRNISLLWKMPDDPYGYRDILIVDKAIDEKTRRHYCDFANSQILAGYMADGQILQAEDGGYAAARSSARVVNLLRTEEKEEELKQFLVDLAAKHVEPFYKRTMETCEAPGLMVYFSGGKFELHADSQNGIVDGNGDMQWTRSFNRDISILLYISKNFTGGQLCFPQYNLKIKPAPGMLVAFPSDANYLHAAEPTESGARLVMVSWIKMTDSPTLKIERKGEVEKSFAVDPYRRPAADKAATKAKAKTKAKGKAKKR